MSGLHVWKETPEKMKKWVKTWRRESHTKFICEICGETLLAKTKPEPGFSREHWGPEYHPVLMGCNEVLAERVHES